MKGFKKNFPLAEKQMQMTFVISVETWSFYEMFNPEIGSWGFQTSKKRPVPKPCKKKGLWWSTSEESLYCLGKWILQIRGEEVSLEDVSLIAVECDETVFNSSFSLMEKPVDDEN